MLRKVLHCYIWNRPVKKPKRHDCIRAGDTSCFSFDLFYLCIKAIHYVILSSLKLRVINRWDFNIFLPFLRDPMRRKKQ